MVLARTADHQRLIEVRELEAISIINGPDGCTIQNDALLSIICSYCKRSMPIMFQYWETNGRPDDALPIYCSVSCWKADPKRPTGPEARLR